MEGTEAGHFRGTRRRLLQAALLMISAATMLLAQNSAARLRTIVYGCGIIFSQSHGRHPTEEVIFRFPGQPGGEYPVDIISDRKGTFYGVTFAGDDSTECIYG